MVKKLCIINRDKTYKDYFIDFKGNKSNFIEEHFLIGVETETSELSNYKRRILDLKTNVSNLHDENNKLKLVVSNYKARFDKKIIKDVEKEQAKEHKTEKQRKVALVKGILNSGVLQND